MDGQGFYELCIEIGPRSVELTTGEQQRQMITDTNEAKHFQ